MALRCVLGNICRRSAGRRLVENNSSTRSLRILKPSTTSPKIWDDANYKEELQDQIEFRRGGCRRCGYRIHRTDKYLPLAQSTNDPNIMALAHLAVEEFNKQKNAQLQFVRAVKAYRQCEAFARTEEYYYLTLEATDADVVKTYQAIVVKEFNDVPVVQLHIIGIVDDNDSRTLLELYNNPVIYRPLDSRDDRPEDGGITDQRKEITNERKEIEAHLDLIANHHPMMEEFQKNKMEAALSLC